MDTLPLIITSSIYTSMLCSTLLYSLCTVYVCIYMYHCTRDTVIWSMFTMLTLLATPPSPPPPSLPFPPLQRRQESLSSNPSSYTPLHPSGRGVRDRDPGRQDHSVFSSQSNEMSHSVKLVDKSWHWDDKGMEVRGGGRREGRRGGEL